MNYRREIKSNYDCNFFYEITKCPKSQQITTLCKIGDQNLPPALWFEQTLDHFHPTDSRVWQQRYFINDSFYEPGGPIFLMIGGEGPANPIWMVEGSWMDYAKEHKALCLQLEHRFYGESHPTEDLSVKNLVYLTSTQALADLATFIGK